MKHKHQNYVSQSLNPVLGFGWFTGSSLKNKGQVDRNQSHKIKIRSTN